MIESLIQPLLRLGRISLAPPALVAGAQLQQALQPGHRAHQLHLLKWASAQLSALIGVGVILFAIDFTQWLPRSLSFLQFFTRWDDVTDYLPAEWRWAGVVLAVGGFLVQLPLTFLARWAEWRTTWYVISDQGVQLKHGLWTMHETSLRFANIQHVTLKQGPLQRLLGLADVVLSTAGGRPAEDEDDQPKNQGRLRDLTYAQAQDLLNEIRSQLPDAGKAVHQPPATSVTAPGALEAAQLLLAETQALRQTLEQQWKEVAA